MTPWKIYERMIAQLFADQSATDLCVTPNAHIRGVVSGTMRQIDVLIEPRHAPNMARRAIVEAKRLKRKIHVKDVELLLGMMDDVASRFGYLVCPAGHSEAALKRAQDSVRICLVPLDRIANFDPTSWPACKNDRCAQGRVFWDGFPQVELRGVSISPPTAASQLILYPQKVGKCDYCGAFHINCLSCSDILLVPHADEADEGHQCRCALPWFWIGSIERGDDDRLAAELHLVTGLGDILTVNRRPL